MPDRRRINQPAAASRRKRTLENYADCQIGEWVFILTREAWAKKNEAGPPSGEPASFGINVSAYSLTTFSAAGPFWPWTTSNSTRSPSTRFLNPSARMAE